MLYMQIISMCYAGITNLQSRSLTINWLYVYVGSTCLQVSCYVYILELGNWDKYKHRTSEVSS